MHHRAIRLLHPAVIHHSKLASPFSLTGHFFPGVVDRACVRHNTARLYFPNSKKNTEETARPHDKFLEPSKGTVVELPGPQLAMWSKNVLKARVIPGDRKLHESSLAVRQNGHSFRESLDLAKHQHIIGRVLKNSGGSSHAAHRVNIWATCATSIEPDLLSEDDVQFTDQGRAFPHHTGSATANTENSYCSWDDPSLVGIAIGPVPLDTRPEPLLPPCTTTCSLYQNLLYLLSYRTPPPLTALLHYHFSQAPGIRSVRSYNLLLALALRHSSFGTIQRLLSAMRREGIRGNLETSKLRVRWLVQIGWWDKAWNQVVGPGPLRNEYRKSREVAGQDSAKKKDGILLPIWLEFFRTTKRGAFRRHVRNQRQCEDEQSEVAREQVLEVIREPADSTTLHATRYSVLMRNPPVLTPHELSRTPPRTVYFLVRSMLRSEKKQTALEFTKSYLSGLPSWLRHKKARACLDLIHLLIVFGSSNQGFRRHRDAREICNTLLSLHPRVRPTSTTLFLLLGTLRRTKHCGTTAWKLHREFKAQWGLRVEDRRVRRRIASFAVTEGRMDIVQTIQDAEKASRWSYGMWRLQHTVLGGTERVPPRRLLRMRRVFKRRGREEWKWKLLQLRVKRFQERKGQVSSCTSF